MRSLKMVALIAGLLAACAGEDDTNPDSHPIEPGADAAGEEPDARSAEPPALGCDPDDTPGDQLCRCMAEIVCDQIYYCLDAEEIAAKPEYWSPRSRCAAELVEDCLEDLESDPDEYLPADFSGCVRDLGAATCDAFGDFSSVSEDFPATCENLRALDTGLGVMQ